MADLSHLRLDPHAELPLYRQLADQIEHSIVLGALPRGERLPATRELAGQLGLNRTTVSAAYAALEQAGLLRGEVGRGSFVADPPLAPPPAPGDFVWQNVLPAAEPPVPSAPVAISFASSRPAAEAFPLDVFRRLAREVIEGTEAAAILQLGSPYGYEPLRRYLLDQARRAGIARPGDDVLITNGCQQALDLLSRVLVAPGTPVLLEDPAYHGALRVFARAGAAILPVPSGENGSTAPALDEILRRTPAQPGRSRLFLVTPNFQNPTGATLPLEVRSALLAAAQRAGLIVIENDIYSALRYTGADLPALKQLDATGNTILLGSYSKVAFPGLRVGWVLAPRPVIARLAEAKQISDLHSDQLSQAVLLRFAVSGELARHVEKTRRTGGERLEAALNACRNYLPAGAQYTRPQGGMNLWIELPAPLLAETLLIKAEERGVNFLPGPYFSSRRDHVRGLRISFGGLAPAEITRGIEILGDVAEAELAGHRDRAPLEPVAALV